MPFPKISARVPELETLERNIPVMEMLITRGKPTDAGSGYFWVDYHAKLRKIFNPYNSILSDSQIALTNTLYPALGYKAWGLYEGYVVGC